LWRWLPGPRRWLFGGLGRGGFSDYTSTLLLCRLYAAPNENRMSGRLSAPLLSICLSSRCLTGFSHHWPTAMGSACIATPSTDGHAPTRPASGANPALCQQFRPVMFTGRPQRESIVPYLPLAHPMAGASAPVSANGSIVSSTLVRPVSCACRLPNTDVTSPAKVT
jgi:hypothetical protein